MAREIVVSLWCDPCLAEEVRTEAEELPPFVLPGMRGRPRVLALCEVHRKELFEPLLTVLREHGQLAEEARPAARPVPAPEDRTGQSPTDGRAPRYHRNLYAEFFLKDVRRGVDVWACPACGNEHTGQSNSLNNLGAHHRHKHGTTLASVLEKRLGPDRMSRLVRGVGGMLMEPPTG